MPSSQALCLLAITRRHGRRQGASLRLHLQSETQPQEAPTWGRRCGRTLHRRLSPMILVLLLAAKTNPLCTSKARRCNIHLAPTKHGVPLCGCPPSVPPMLVCTAHHGVGLGGGAYLPIALSCVPFLPMTALEPAARS